MRERWAQERHSHGVPIFGAGQRGLQIVPETGDGISSWGRQSPGQFTTSNTGTNIVQIMPDLSGSALLALSNANSGYVSSGTHTEQNIWEAASSVSNHPQFIWDGTQDVRWRWRFGATPWDTSVTKHGWLAAMIPDYNGSIYVTMRNEGNLWSHDFESAENLYTLTGDLDATTGLHSAGPRGLFEYGHTAGRFFGVGVPSGDTCFRGGSGTPITNMVAVFKASLATASTNTGVIDLGFGYTVGDLVTWDFTYLAGASHASMKVWKQTNVTDAPVSAEFKVPVEWLPFSAAYQATTTDAVFNRDIMVSWYDSVHLTWRHGTKTCTVIFDTGGWQVGLPAVGSAIVGYDGGGHPIYETAYTAFSIGPKSLPGSGSNTGGMQFAGALNADGGNTWSGSWGGAGTVIGGRFEPASGYDTTNPSTNAGPSFWSATDYLMPASPVALLLDATDTNTTDRMKWCGFLMPRPSDDYVLFGH